MTLKIEIVMDNAAFADESGTEAARILRRLAHEIEGADMHPDFRRVLYDIDGNATGKATANRRH